MQPTKVVGRRVGALLIDTIVVSIFNFIVFFALADTEDEILDQLQDGEIDFDTTLYINLDLGGDEYSIVGGGNFLVYVLITAIVAILYWMILPGITGWTLGKLATGIRVVKDDGTMPAGIGKNVVRQIMWIADSFPYLIPYLTGFIVALTNNRNKRVGDMVAGTLVVKASAAGQPIAVAAPGAAFGQQPGGFGQPVGGGFAQPGQQPGFAQPGAQPGGFAPAPGAAPAAAPAAQPAATGAAPADWYPDPKGEKRLRYWDGGSWTDHTAD